MRALAWLTLVLLLAACSTSATSGKDDSVLGRSGAAKQALECTNSPYDGGAVEYGDGLLTVQHTYTAALEGVVDPTGTSEYVPTSGYHVERDDGERVLLTWDVAGHIKVAFVAYDKIVDYTGDTGWGIESWAMCDPAEFPASVTARMDVEIWHDRDGARVPIAQVLTYPDDWCEVQGTRMLQVGHGRTTTSYLQDPAGQASRYVTGTYSADVTLPDAAADTGFNNGERELWLAADGSYAYLVSRDDATDVQRWPAIQPGVGCG